MNRRLKTPVMWGETIIASRRSLCVMALEEGKAQKDVKIVSLEDRVSIQPDVYRTGGHRFISTYKRNTPGNPADTITNASLYT